MVVVEQIAAKSRAPKHACRHADPALTICGGVANYLVPSNRTHSLLALSGVTCLKQPPIRSQIVDPNRHSSSSDELLYGTSYSMALQEGIQCLAREEGDDRVQLHAMVLLGGLVFRRNRRAGVEGVRSGPDLRISVMDPRVPVMDSRVSGMLIRLRLMLSMGSEAGLSSRGAADGWRLTQHN